MHTMLIVHARTEFLIEGLLHAPWAILYADSYRGYLSFCLST